MIIWLTGLSGAGKTSIGRGLYEKIKKKSANTVFLEGDLIREIMGNDLGYTLEDRKKNLERICGLCRLLDSQDINVVCCVLYLFHEYQDWNRREYKKYFEVYLEVSMETLIRRNQKGLYQKALKGEVKNVVGFDIKFNPPKNPDLIINNDKELENLERLVEEIYEKLAECYL